MRVHIFDSPELEIARRHITETEILDCVYGAFDEVRQSLPAINPYANISIRAVDKELCIPETHMAGTTYNGAYSELIFDKSVPGGPVEMLKSLRRLVFHESVHIAMFERDPWRPDVMYGVATEGMATVFEREYAPWKPYWGEYEDDDTMRAWYEELKMLQESNEKNRDYFFMHPDGRRWIVYKTGAWVVDKLVESGETIAGLAELKYTEILDKFEAISRE